MNAQGFIVNKLLLPVRDLEFTDRPSESSAEKPRDFYIPQIDFSQGTAVASNRPTEALASVISFTFVVYSHLIPRKRTQPWTDCLGLKSSMDIASVISFFWLRPCNSIDKYKYMKDLFMSPYRSFTYLPFSNYLTRHPSHLFPTHLPFSKLC